MDNKNYLMEGWIKTELSELPLREFVGDLELRWQAMNGLIDDILKRYKNKINSFKVLDLALGDGHDSIFLIKRGYDVTSNEVDNVYISQANDNAVRENVRLNIRKCYWQEIDKSPLYKSEEFDFAFCLGNSFPNYLLNGEDRIKSLQNFWAVLKKGGTLLFDSRNFDYMINKKDFILKNPEINFKYLGKTTFLNKDLIHGFPIEISNSLIHFVWKHYGYKKYAEMNLWPATIGNVKKLIQDSIEGDIRYEIFYDYHKQKPEHYDFVQYLLYKDQ